MPPAEPTASPRPKATLFCRTCGHESPVRGDWEVRTSHDRVTTTCPECGTTVDERPAHDNRGWNEVVPGVTTASRLVDRALASLTCTLKVGSRI